jgi:hypothetical protein
MDASTKIPTDNPSPDADTIAAQARTHVYALYARQSQT